MNFAITGFESPWFETKGFVFCCNRFAGREAVVVVGVVVGVGVLVLDTDTEGEVVDVEVGVGVLLLAVEGGILLYAGNSC